jgi:hypothetical protein
MMPFRLTTRFTGRSINDLSAHSATVRYELDMLLETAKRFGKALAEGDRVGQNMAVESFAVHCRAMILFLYGHLEGMQAAGENDQRFTSAKDNDLFAWDYFPGWQFDCPAPSDEMFHAKRRADKHVAHIVTQRRGVNQPGSTVESVWNMNAVVNEIGRCMALFISRAPAANFATEELRLMTERLVPWVGSVPAPAVPIIARSGPLDQPGTLAGLQARTDARTLSSGGSGVNLTGRNE